MPVPIALVLLLSGQTPVDLKAPAEARPKAEAQAAAQRGDFRGAIRLLTPLAEAGDVDALGNLGNAYAFASGPERDLAMASKYWHLAAEKHLGTAMGNIAVLHMTGQGGLAKDPGQAATWYRKAAEHRHFSSMLTLSSLYAMGQGIGKDPIRALAWAALAAGNAPSKGEQERAMAQVRQIQSTLAPEQVEAVRALTVELVRIIDANVAAYRKGSA